MKKISYVLILILVFSLCGCSHISNYTSSKENKYSDDYAYPVTIENVQINKSPDKIVSLSPAITQMISDLGFKSRLVGVSSYCQDITLDDVKRVGSPAKPDIKAIIDVKPDIVLTQSPIAFSDVTILNDNGIKVISKSTPINFTEIIDYYGMLSQILVGKGNSESLTGKTIAKMESEFDKFRDKKYNFKFVYIMTDSLAVATPDVLAGDILRPVGENIASDYSALSMSEDEIAAADPDIVFLSNNVNKDNLPDKIKNLPAFSQDNVIILDDSLMSKPTIQITELFKAIEEKLEGKTQVVS